MKWEYREEALEAEETAGDGLVDYLSDWGDDGWELCNIIFIGFVMHFVWKREAKISLAKSADNSKLLEATEHISALLCELETAAMMASSDVNNPGQRGDNWPAYQAAKAYLEVIGARNEGGE